MNENYSCIFWNKELNENTSADIYSLALMSTQYGGQKSLILFIAATCVIVLVLLSVLTIFQKRKSFKNFRAKKDRKGKLSPTVTDENRHSSNSQTETSYLSTVAYSGESRNVSL